MGIRYLILPLLLFAGCNKPFRQNDKITRIELARNGAWSDFGASISIDSSLNYEYWGDYSQVKQGYFKGTISKAYWDTLNKRFSQIRFRTVKTNNDINCEDCEEYEMIIRWRGNSRKILRTDYHNRPDSVLSFIKWVDSSYKHVNLHSTKDSIKFDLNLHGRPMPISFKSLKFPPPGRK